jgi:hypothetical protein
MESCAARTGSHGPPEPPTLREARMPGRVSTAFKVVEADGSSAMTSHIGLQYEVGETYEDDHGIYAAESPQWAFRTLWVARAGERVFVVEFAEDDVKARWSSGSGGSHLRLRRCTVVGEVGLDELRALVVAESENNRLVFAGR